MGYSLFVTQFCCIYTKGINLNRISLLLIGFLMGAPLSSVCGAETSRDFAKWEKNIVAYELSDRINPPPRHALLFVGSSMIFKWTTLARDFPGQPVINRGVNGTQIVDATHFADRIIFPYSPRMIFLRAGGNDLWAGKSVETVFGDFQTFVATVHARLPETTVYFISWSPTPFRWKQHEKEIALNALVAEYARHTPKVGYIETYDMVLGDDGKPRPELFIADQIHFNVAGYQLLAARVRPFLPPLPEH